MLNRLYHIYQGVISGIRGLNTESLADMPFICVEDAQGAMSGAEDYLKSYMRRTREFDVRSNGFTSTGPGCNVLTNSVIRIVYQLNCDTNLLDSIINEDVRAIINEIMFKTIHWGSMANSVYMEELAEPFSEIIVDGKGAPCNLLVSIPFVVDWRREE
jgi:hypothetical protein